MMTLANLPDHRESLLMNNKSMSAIVKRERVTHNDMGTTSVQAYALPDRYMPPGAKGHLVNSNQTRKSHGFSTPTAKAPGNLGALGIVPHREAKPSNIEGGKFIPIQTTSRDRFTPRSARIPSRDIRGRPSAVQIDLTQDENEAVAMGYPSDEEIRQVRIRAYWLSINNPHPSDTHTAASTSPHPPTPNGTSSSATGKPVRKPDTPVVKSFSNTAHGLNQTSITHVDSNPPPEITSGATAQQGDPLKEWISLRSVPEPWKYYLLKDERKAKWLEQLCKNLRNPEGGDIWYDENNNVLAGPPAGTWIVNLKYGTFTKQLDHRLAPVQRMEEQIPAMGYDREEGMKIIRQSADLVADSHIRKNDYGTFVNAQRGAFKSRDIPGGDSVMKAPISEQRYAAFPTFAPDTLHDRRVLGRGTGPQAPMLDLSSSNRKTSKGGRAQSGEDRIYLSPLLDDYSKTVGKIANRAWHDDREHSEDAVNVLKNSKDVLLVPMGTPLTADLTAKLNEILQLNNERIRSQSQLDQTNGTHHHSVASRPQPEQIVETHELSAETQSQVGQTTRSHNHSLEDRPQPAQTLEINERSGKSPFQLDQVPSDRNRTVKSQRQLAQTFGIHKLSIGSRPARSMSL